MTLQWIPEPVRSHVRKPVVWYRSRVQRWHSDRLLRSLGNLLHRGKDYHEYLVTQVTRSWAMRAKTDAGNRVENLVQRFLESTPGSSREGSVLCVGCRNRHELSVFREKGFEEVIGIELFSEHQDIVQMDMHAMEFPDDRFDVLFSCHSLEHSYDPSQALSEFCRVTRDGGACIIEVPVRFKRSLTDLQDFGSVDNLLSACRQFAGHVLLAEEYRSDISTCARLAFIVDKNRQES